MSIVIEYLKQEDVEAYVTMLNPILKNPVELDVFKRRFKPDHPTTKVIVAKKEGEIVGTITFALVDNFNRPEDSRLEFWNFATSLAARGTDAAKLLMSFTFDFAKEFGYGLVAVNCYVDAVRAHGFYKKMGFEESEIARFVKKI